MSNPRSQLKHMLMDVDFFDKPTVRALGFKHTQVSVLLYVRWLMLMSRATNALVTRDAMASIAREVLHGMGTSVATFETVLQYCLDTEMIIEESPGCYTNDRVVKDQEACAVKRVGAVQRQAKFREKKGESGNALQTRLPVHVHVDDHDHEFDLIKEMDTPAIRAEVAKVAEKFQRDSKGKRRLHQQTLDNWQAEFLGKPEAFLRALKNTNSKTYALNLIRDDDQPRAGPAKKSTKDTLNEMMAQALAEQANAET